MFTKRIRFICALIAAFAMTAACGGGGEGESGDSGVPGDFTDISGAILHSSGNQGYFTGWYLVFMERDSGRCSVGLRPIDNAGLYQVPMVAADRAQTLFLLNSQFILQAVLAVPSDNPGALHQFFTLNGRIMPKLMVSGGVISMQTRDNVTLLSDTVPDADGDGAPSGVASIMAAGLNQPSYLVQSTEDTDGDGIPNIKDADIDGDGLVNRLDADNDNDGLLDHIDRDAEDDLVNDETQTIGDQYFGDIVEYIGVVFELKPAETGVGSQTTLRMNLQLRSDLSPWKVGIKGAPTLINGSLEQFPAPDEPDDNEEGEDPAEGAEGVANPADIPITENAFDKFLEDDGESWDWQKGDSIYGDQLKLVSGQFPRFQEFLFLSVYMQEDLTRSFDYPFIFPNIRPDAIRISYEPLQKIIKLVSSFPFGEDITAYKWNAQVFDTGGTAVWISPDMDGSENVVTVPDNVMDDGETYFYNVAVQTLAKVPGYPAYVIHSTKCPMDGNNLPTNCSSP